MKLCGKLRIIGHLTVATSDSSDVPIVCYSHEHGGKQKLIDQHAQRQGRPCKLTLCAISRSPHVTQMAIMAVQSCPLPITLVTTRRVVWNIVFIWGKLSHYRYDNNNNKHICIAP